MYNKKSNFQERMKKTLLKEEELSSFKTYNKEDNDRLNITKRKVGLDIPKPTFHKRREKNKKELSFYLVMFLISFVSLLINFYFAKLSATCSSLLASLLSLYYYFFTEPYKWKEENKNIAFWNASVTFSVLIKSLHEDLYKRRYMILWINSIGLGASYFISSSMVGVFAGIYFILWFFFLAEQNFKKYAKFSLTLSWLSIPALFFSLFINKSISLGIVIVGLFLYQLYERIKNLEIVEP